MVDNQDQDQLLYKVEFQLQKNPYLDLFVAEES